MSDWAGIKKAINSDLSTPLNHLIWLNDYKTFGEDSYVYNNKDILHKLYRDYELCANDAYICEEAIEVASAEQKVGILLSKSYGFTFEGITNIKTTDDIFNNSELLKILATHPVWKNVYAHKAILKILGNDVNAFNSLSTIFKDATMLVKITKSAEALNLLAKLGHDWSLIRPFVIAVTGDTSLLKNAFSSLNNTTYFTKKVATYSGDVASLNLYATAEYARNGFIACTLGNTSHQNGTGTTLTTNGEIIKSHKKIQGGPSSDAPTTVTANGFSALTVPVSTFTPVGKSGQSAISVYIAV